MESRSIDIAEVVVEGRYRKQMGDILSLAKSIADIGLLHPIVVLADNRLVAGARRLEACKELGWTEIPAYVATNLGTARKLLRAEQDENTCREPFKPSEAVALAAALEPLVQAEAAERKRATQAKPGEKVGSQGPANFAGPTTPAGEARKQVAAAVGMSYTTLDRAKTVVELAESGDQNAIEAREEMDRTGKVTPAYEKATGMDTNRSKRKEAKTTKRKNAKEREPIIPPLPEGFDFPAAKAQLERLVETHVKEVWPWAARHHLSRTLNELAVSAPQSCRGNK